MSNTLNITRENKLEEKKKIWKNVIIISICFLFVFNAFQGLSRLQSSLHRIEGMGVINSSIIYVALVISCLFVPKLMTRSIGYKWTMPLCFVFYILWMAANGYAVWATMMPTSVMVGVAAAPLWISQCSYFTKSAKRYAYLDENPNQDQVITKFFGVFFMVFQMSTITGSIISYTILNTGSHSTTKLSDEYLSATCGINDCPWSNSTNSNLEKPDDKTVWTLLGVYIALSVMAVVIFSIFVDRLPKNLRSDDEGPVCKEIGKVMKSTAYHLKDKKQLLIIPLTIYSGLEQGFLNAEFSKSYVACTMGIWKVGLVLLPYGCVDALTCLVSAHVMKFSGRIPIFITAALVDLSIQITLATYHPSNVNGFVLFVLAGLWGVSDGIWQTQLNSLYGSVFTDTTEAAFANYRMWESVGFAMAFAYSNFLCTSAKLAILSSFLVLGMVGYAVVEKMEHSTSIQRKKQEIELNIKNELAISKTH